jgi:hypothetical protein
LASTLPANNSGSAWCRSIFGLACPRQIGQNIMAPVALGQPAENLMIQITQAIQEGDAFDTTLTGRNCTVTVEARHFHQKQLNL